jgi:hypothetical protein
MGMKILTMCAFGKNRSRYLAEYLEKKGYDTDFAGVCQDHDEVQEKIDVADVIIAVHPDIKEQLQLWYDVKQKMIIGLNVEDRPEVVLPEGKTLDGEAWGDFQEKEVYPILIKDIEERLK